MPPTITTDTGTIAVPMSSILDALEGVLTEAERQALMGQLIGLRPAGVAPGDLITAELFNQVMRDVNDLMMRVAALEGAAGGPVIDSLDPPGTVAVNGRLTVTGRNFNPEPRLNVVKIGDVEITQFRADSTPNQLVFPVPDLFTGLPDSFPVRVLTAGRTSNSMAITIKEQDKIQAGKFAIGAGQTGAGQVTVGGNLTITWPVQAVTMFADNVRLSLLVGNPQGATAAAWLDSLAFQPTSPMAIAVGQTKQVAATLKVPAGATSAQLSLRVESEDGNVVNVSDPVTITVGLPVETSDNRIRIDFRVPAIGHGGMTTGPVTIDGVTGDGVLVKKGQNGKLRFTAFDQRSGAGPTVNFAFAAEIVAPANGLVSGQPNPGSANDVPVGEDRSFDLPLSAPAGAATGATARLKVTCSQTKTSGGLTAYKAFRIIPLKIVD